MVVHDDENLIGHGGDIESISGCFQGLADDIGAFNGWTPDSFVEAVAEQDIELCTQQPALSQQGAVLFDGCKEVRNPSLLRDDDSFSDEGATFCSANIEDCTGCG